MAKEQVVYLKTTGVNYAKPVESLDWAPDGTTELAECLNCYVDSYGKLSRGLGSVAVSGSPISGTVHTLFDKERVFFGVGVNLYELENGVLLLRRSGGSGNRISICVYGGTAYCCDGTELFSIPKTGAVASWSFSAKKGAKSTRPFASPIQHSKSTNGFGRVFILNSGIIFYSDPIGPNLFDYASNVIWDANPIQEFACIKGLMVIGTEKTSFALVGTDWNIAEKVWLTGLPIIPNTLCAGFIDGEEVVCFTVADGMYLVSQGGKSVKLTENKVGRKFFNKEFIGASVLDNRYTVYG